MRNLLLLFRKFGSLFLFLFLELLAFFLIVNYNNKQKEIFLYSSNLFSGMVLERYDASMDYFKLKSQNDSIAGENADLMSLFFNQEKPEVFQSLPQDSISDQYQIIPAKIVSKTINQRNNRFTLNKGRDAGIQPGMGVLSTKGIVGVIHRANSKYSSVMPIINTQFQVSVKIKTKNFLGDLSWEPYDERFMLLKHIPKHAGISKGDTVISSGYSTYFPPDIPIGTIESFALPAGSNYFEVKVELFNQLSNLEYIYVVDNRFKHLQIEMQEDK